MAAVDRIHAVVDPIIDDLELELVDLVYGGGRLKITIDHPDGLDTERLTKATRMISHELDLSDPVSGTYTLEVTSPGIERPLRTPSHFQRSLGEDVSIKLKPNDENIRRLKGELIEATDDDITILQDGESHTLVYDQIAKAKTVFDWSNGVNTGGKRPKAETPEGAESSQKGAQS